MSCNSLIIENLSDLVSFPSSNTGVPDTGTLSCPFQYFPVPLSHCWGAAGAEKWDSWVLLWLKVREMCWWLNGPRSSQRRDSWKQEPWDLEVPHWRHRAIPGDGHRMGGTRHKAAAWAPQCLASCRKSRSCACSWPLQPLLLHPRWGAM